MHADFREKFGTLLKNDHHPPLLWVTRAPSHHIHRDVMPWSRLAGTSINMPAFQPAEAHASKTDESTSPGECAAENDPSKHNTSGSGTIDNASAGGVSHANNTEGDPPKDSNQNPDAGEASKRVTACTFAVGRSAGYGAPWGRYAHHPTPRPSLSDPRLSCPGDRRRHLLRAPRQVN